MQTSFFKIADGLFRLDIPFDHLYTSVFLLDGDHPIIVDAATTREDVQARILPALREMNVIGRNGTLLLTHRHGDHSGGAPFLLEALPAWKLGVLSPNQSCGCVTAIPLPGHTEDSMGYFDTRTGSLLAGDALQFFGVGKYGCSIADAALYEATLARITALSPNAIFPAHDFIGGAARAVGQAEVTAMLNAARDAWDQIKAFILTYPTDLDPFEVVRAWKAASPTLPPLPSTTVKSVRNMFC